MAIEVYDVAELSYGGLVAGFRKWDEKRVKDGNILESDTVKKAGFWAYLVPGAIATGANALGYLRAYEPWTERITHGFIYGFPQFIVEIIRALTPVADGGVTARSAAVKQAQELVSAAQAKKVTTRVGAAVLANTGAAVTIEEILA